MKELLKVVIITRAEKLTDLKEAMDELRVPGMTVTQVYGKTNVMEKSAVPPLSITMIGQLPSGLAV